MRVSPSTILFLLLANLAMPPVAEAQIANADSVFSVGPCRIRTPEPVKWEDVVSHVDQPPRIVPATIPFFPTHLRTSRGYSGKIVLAMVVDTAGRVEPGSVSVEESTDSRLSAWGCLVALQMRYLPALVGGKPVSALTEQPLSYIMGRVPGRP